MANKWCDNMVREYANTARDCTNEQLEDHLYRFYPVLKPDQRRDPMFRHWRRCVIVEMLKRGLLKTDPGPNGPLPERR